MEVCSLFAQPKARHKLLTFVNSIGTGYDGPEEHLLGAVALLPPLFEACDRIYHGAFFGSPASPTAADSQAAQKAMHNRTPKIICTHLFYCDSSFGRCEAKLRGVRRADEAVLEER